MAIKISDLEVTLSASGSFSKLDDLSSKLGNLESTLSRIESGKIQDLATGIKSLGNSLNTLKGTSKLNTLSKNLTQLANIDTQNLNKSLSTLGSINTATQGVSSGVANIEKLANAIGQLGYKKVSTAINNLPLLTTELEKMITTLSQTPTVSENTIRLTEALAKLASNGAKVGSASRGFKQFFNTASKAGTASGFFKQLGTLVSASGTKFAKFGGVLSGLGGIFDSTKKRTASFQGSLDKLLSTVGKLYATFWLLKRMLSAVISAVQSASNWIETFNLFESVESNVGADHADEFKSAGYNDAETYANSFEDRTKDLISKMSGYDISESGLLVETGAESLGLDADMLANYSSRFLNIANSMGVMGETAYSTSSALTRLGADMSSLYNTNLTDTYDNLISGLAGQARVLDKYGINIRNANLQTYAYKYGLDGAVSSMSQATKEQLRIIAILDQSKASWGDMARTLNTPANQMRLLKQNVVILARSFGTLLLPAVAAVLPYLNALIIVLNRAISWIGAITGLFGKASGLTSGLAQSGSDLSDIYDEVESAADSATSATDGTGSSADSTSKKIAKLKRTLMGFDKINKLEDNSSSSTSTPSTSGGTGSSGLPADYDLSDAINSLLNAYDSSWNDAMNSMSNKAYQIASKITEYAKKGDWYGLGQWIGNSLVATLKSIPWASIYKAVGNFGKGLAEFLNGLISPNLFGTVASTIAMSLNTALNFGYYFSKTFNFKNLGDSIANGINTFFKTFEWAKLGTTISNFVDGMIKTIRTVIEKTDWTTVFSSISDMLTHMSLPAIALTFGGFSLAKGALATLAKTLGPEILTGIATAIAGSPLAIGALAVTLGVISLPLLDTASKFLVSILKALDKIDWAKIGEKFGTFLGTAIGNFDFGSVINVSVLLGTLMTKLPLNMIKLGAYMIKGLAKGLSKGLIKQINKWCIKLDKKIRDFFGIHSPSTLFAKYGVYMVEGLVNGLESKINDLLAWFGSLPEKIEEALGSVDIGSMISGAISSAAGLAADAVVSISATLPWDKVGFKSWILSKITDTVEKELGIALPWGSNFVDWLKAKITGTISKALGITLPWSGTTFAKWMSGKISSVTASLTPSLSAPKGYKSISAYLQKKISSSVKNVALKLKLSATISKDAANEIIKKIQAKVRAFHIAGYYPLKNVTFPTFATGGFPEEGPFMMNRGEIAGKFGSTGKSVVANNQQITNGIANAVSSSMYSAISKAMAQSGNNNSNTTVVLQGDAKQMFKVVRSEANRYTQSTGRPAFNY